MLSVEEAQARVMDEVAVAAPELVPLADAHGRVLREEVAAAYDMPVADNSGMDGYAVRADDIAQAPVTLPVRGDIPAGHPATHPLEAGTAMRIMTGAFVPEGADTVVQVELTDGGIDVVRIDQALQRGANIRKRGEDMHRGDILLRSGVRIGAAEMTVLAAMQKTRVSVGPRPTVAILTTGDELVDVGEPLAAGKIVNTNAWLLASLIRETGALPISLGIVRDTKEATIAALERAAESDFILSSGGVSVGAYDFVKDALDTLGADTKFWRVNMKPGKPVVVSRLRERVVFGLPGNPVSSFVSFHLFVAPALRKAMGQESRLFPPSIRATLTRPLKSAGERRVYFRVAVNAAMEATPLASQGSGSLTSMLGANGLAIVPEGMTRVEAGSPIDVLLIGALV
jgi:molybdopterin molybdotransferase